MARLDWLATVLREAGLTVFEHPGWQTRGRDGMRPRVVIGHHTATHWTTPDSVVTNLLVKGRGDLPGPLSQLGLNRQGQFIVIAAGKANHAGAGSWMDANESVEAIGIEAYNYGNGVPFPSREPWPQVQLEAYSRGVAALLKHIGRDYRHFCGHREWAQPPGRKPDPSGINLDTMRAHIRSLMEDEMSFTPTEESWLKKLAARAAFLEGFAADMDRLDAQPDSVGHVLSTYRLVAKKLGVSGIDHDTIATRLLGQ